MTNQPNKWIKKALQKLRKERGSKCEECGSTIALQFAHIKETELKGGGRGRKERYYDIVKNPECYKLFCGYCHREFDRKKRETERARTYPPELPA